MQREMDYADKKTDAAESGIIWGNHRKEEERESGPDSVESRKYAYWFSCASDFNYRVQKLLITVCGSAKEIYGLDSRQLEKIPGLMHKDAGRLIESKKTWDTDLQWERLEQSGVRFTSLECGDYPPQLRELADAPYGIFYRGRLPQPDELRVAVVGARMCSEYGRGIAREIGRQLAAWDVPVVSGMARGIDAAGHRGALDCGGDTYAVLGCGADVCYPNYHRQLYYEIAQHGGLLSQYPPGTKPLAWHFPQRNRLISVLSDAVFIIEAKEKSGSLITADFALEQGRDVYALPGRITDALSSGCNRLIEQGAGIILSVEDCLEQLAMQAGRKKKTAQEAVCTKKAAEAEKQKFDNLHKFSLEKDELLVYGCLGLLPTGMEQILEQTGFDVQSAGRALSALLQKHYIEEVFKNCYKIR